MTTHWTPDVGDPLVGRVKYEEAYERSLIDPVGFWGERAAAMLDWSAPWREVVTGGFEAAAGPVRWFAGGELNATQNCVDRHVAAGLGGKPAIVFEAVDGAAEIYTYTRLLEESARLAGVLRGRGVGQGDRVVLYLPLIPELPIAMLACGRIGAVHSVVFAGFSGRALEARIANLSASAVVTTDGGWRRGAAPGLKDEIDKVLTEGDSVHTVVVVRARELREGAPASEPREPGVEEGPAMTPGRDLWWHEAMSSPSVEPVLDCVPVEASHPLFVLWTSGTSGIPKGIVHSTGGYLLYAAETYQVLFEHRASDVHFCAVDIGWITGHTYLVYGPLAVGSTVLLYEGAGTETYPERFFDIIARHGVTTFSSSPSVVHAMVAVGDRWMRSHAPPRLRVVASTGDPLSSEARAWFGAHITECECSVLDTWWQTESGGILLSPLPGTDPVEGDVLRPFFGVEPTVLGNDGVPVDPGEIGNICHARPWPGFMRGLWGDDASDSRMRALYLSRFDGFYNTGDQASADGRGGFLLEGALGDDMWVWGHFVSSADIERALLFDPSVVEAAVVGFADPDKGEGIYCYVVVRDNVDPTESLGRSLATCVSDAMGPFVVPDKIHFVPTLPRTRSGKLVRRVLRHVAEGRVDDIGDTSILADPSTVDDLRNVTASWIWTIDSEARP